MYTKANVINVNINSSNNIKQDIILLIQSGFPFHCVAQDESALFFLEF